VLYFVVTGLAVGRFPVQGVLSRCLKGFIVPEVNFESKQGRGPGKKMEGNNCSQDLLGGTEDHYDNFSQESWSSWRNSNPVHLELTPWSRFLLEKLIFTQLVKKFPTFY
jgi:hypothetical protein